MANRVQKEQYDNKVLVLKEFINGEVVEIKESETLEPGQVLIFSQTDKKYVKYVKTTHGAKLASEVARLRVYKGESNFTSTSSENKVAVLRQGLVNKALIKGLEEEDFNLVAQLELQGIFMEGVK